MAIDKTRVLLKAQDALDHLAFIRHKKQEYLVCLSLDSGCRLIKRRVITIGLLDTSLAHPREVFSDALKDRAASIIVAHNHPSGMAKPSKRDIGTTQQLAAAGILLGVPLYDHIIVAKNEEYSFRESGLL